MEFKHITSKENAIVKRLKKIADNSRFRQREAVTLLDGVHLIQAYYQLFGAPALLIIPEGHSSDEATNLMQQLQDEVTTVMLPTLLFADLTPVASSTGILALIDRPEIVTVAQPNMALLLEDVQDPGNMGSILRAAAAAGVQQVYLSKACTDAWSPKALRGGQGAQFILPITEQIEVREILATFAGQSYALAMQGESLYQQDLTGDCLFLMGNEGQGLSPDSLHAADQVITIPMASNNVIAVESLNVAAATAVTLFECQRQKQLV